MKNPLHSLTTALLALALGFLSCGGPDAPDAGGPIKIAVFTPFPTGTTANAAVDVQYEATPSGGASIAQVSYSINGGSDEYVYLKGGNGVTAKGTLGSARVMLAPGENHVVFMAKDSVGNFGHVQCHQRPHIRLRHRPLPQRGTPCIAKHRGGSPIRR